MTAIAPRTEPTPDGDRWQANSRPQTARARRTGAHLALRRPFVLLLVLLFASPILTGCGGDAFDPADSDDPIVGLFFESDQPNAYEVLEDHYGVDINEPGRWSQYPHPWMIDDIWRECYVVGRGDLDKARLMCDVYVPGEAKYAELPLLRG